jgi:hypothetical protein
MLDREKSTHLYTNNIQPNWTPIGPIIKNIRIGKNLISNSINNKNHSLIIGIVIKWINDPNNVRKHGLSCIVFSCIGTKEGLYLLTPLHQNFHIDQRVVEEMNKLKTFANWTTFVPQLKNFYHGSNHAIKSCTCPLRPLRFHCFLKNIFRTFLICLSKKH